MARVIAIEHALERAIIPKMVGPPSAPLQCTTFLVLLAFGARLALLLDVFLGVRVVPFSFYPYVFVHFFLAMYITSSVYRKWAKSTVQRALWMAAKPMSCKFYTSLYCSSVDVPLYIFMFHPIRHQLSQLYNELFVTRQRTFCHARISRV